MTTQRFEPLLEPHQLATVQLHADKLLRDAAAYGRFPTPVDDIMAAAKLVVVGDEVLNEDFLQRFMKNIKAGVATFKSAISKVLGLFDSVDRMVLIDKDTPKPRVPFVKLHEAGHGSLPHQSKMYRLIHDCEDTLDPEITDLFECEANVFASEALFQGSSLLAQLEDQPINLRVPMDLAKKVGASNYAAFRRYVVTNSRACCVIALDPPDAAADGTSTRPVRRIVASRSFSLVHDISAFNYPVSSLHPLAAALPRPGKRMAAERELILIDRNGDRRLCITEAFDTRHQVLILVRDAGAITRSSILMPG